MGNFSHWTFFVSFISTFFCLPFFFSLFSSMAKDKRDGQVFTDVPYYSLKTVKIFGWCLNIKQQKSFYNSLQVEAYHFFFLFFFLLMLESVISLSTSGINDAVVMVRLAHFLTPPASGPIGRLRWSWMYPLFHLAHPVSQGPQREGMCGSPRDVPSGMGRETAVIPCRWSFCVTQWTGTLTALAIFKSIFFF